MLKRGENASGGGGGVKYEQRVSNVYGTRTYTIDATKSYLVFTYFSAGGHGISVVEKGVLTHNAPAWQVNVSVSGTTLKIVDTNSGASMAYYIFSFDGEFDANGIIA